jgi:hypothetical protein
LAQGERISLSAVRRIDQALKVTNATLVKVPFDLAHWRTAASEKYPNGLPEPYSDDPTQWLFHGHPRYSEAGTEVHAALARLVRRGADILIALCLGADLVVMGRPTLYGAAAGGLAGVKKAVDIFRTEIDLVMGQIGCTTLDQLGPVFCGPRIGDRTHNGVVGARVIARPPDSRRRERAAGRLQSDLDVPRPPGNDHAMDQTSPLPALSPDEVRVGAWAEVRSRWNYNSLRWGVAPWRRSRRTPASRSWT